MLYGKFLDGMWIRHLRPKGDGPTVVSLFAGCGGSSLGYSMAGYRELLAVEFDPLAAASFRTNFSGVPVWDGDARDLSVEECGRIAGVRAGELDVLDASPPCQGFSLAGKRRYADGRNDLFFEFARLLKGLMPKAFLAENVPGLARGKMRIILRRIMAELRRIGYKVEARFLNAKYFHVPQARERLIIFGVRRDLNISPDFLMRPHRSISVWEALQKCPSGLTDGIFAEKRLIVAGNIKQGREGSDIIPNKLFNLKRLHWHKPAYTVIAIIGRSKSLWGGGLIHPKYDRHLTIPELKRISSFPDEFQFMGNYENQWRQIGNCVPPLFMYHLARHIRRLLGIQSGCRIAGDSEND